MRPAPLIPLQDGEVLASKYRIVRTLGVGGMGVVYAARHLVLDEMVAIKVLLPTQLARPDAAARFLREGRAASKIKSEHVARVIDVGSMESGLPFLVMEYLEGQDLATRIHEAGPQPVALVIDWVLQACEAMIEAHSKGIVHRDLKPSNLFLARRHDGVEVVKVLDFGISKVSGELADGLLTASQAVMGSPFYMAPEQMSASGQVDARADVWSLGCILFEALVGRPPFMADDVTILVARVLHSPTPLLRSERPDVPAALEALVARCLAKSAAERFPSVRALVDALLPLASDPSLAGRFVVTASGGRSLSVSDASSFQDTMLHEQPAEPALASSSMTPGSPVRPAAGPARPSWLLGLIALGLVGVLAVGAMIRRKDSGSSIQSPSAEPARPAESGALPARSAPVVAESGAASAASALPVVSIAPVASSSAPPAAAVPHGGAGPAKSIQKPPTKAVPVPAGLPRDRD